jgi:Na+/proline symporter
MEKSKLMFLVLAVCGTACVLGSLWAINFHYHEQAVQFARGQPEDIIPFAIFVWLPSLAGFVIGVVLVKVGISIGLRDKT